MPTITRRIEFDAGHRVLGHEGHCRFLHGHHYRLDVTVTAPEVNALGMVVDFGVVKEKVGGWVNENLDHNFLCHPDDPLVKFWNHRNDTSGLLEAGRLLLINLLEGLFNGRAPYVMPPGQNPTAENIARLVYNESHRLLDGLGLTVHRVRCYETPNCFADHYGD